jgi:hypothetical protein
VVATPLAGILAGESDEAATEQSDEAATEQSDERAHERG